jgi:hypothetical protein
MDPNACFSELLEALACDDYPDAIEAATNLNDWLLKDGFAPGDDKIDRNSILVFCQWVLDKRDRLPELDR